MEFVNSKLLNEKKIKELELEFAGDEPYKHVLIRNFLEDDRAVEVFKALKKEKFEHKESDLFSFSQTMDLKFVENKVLKKFYEFFCSKEFNKLIEEVSGIKLGMGKIDMAGTLYEDCDYLLCHDDQLKGRKIAFVYYLSEGFKEKDGGCFVMLDSKEKIPRDIIKKYLPLWNSFLIFEVSEKSFHEVEEVIENKKRYAIGGWFH